MTTLEMAWLVYAAAVTMFKYDLTLREVARGHELLSGMADRDLEESADTLWAAEQHLDRVLREARAVTKKELRAVIKAVRDEIDFHDGCANEDGLLVKCDLHDGIRALVEAYA